MPSYHKNKTAASNAISDLIRAVLHLSATAERKGSQLTKNLGVTSSRWQLMAQLHWSQERLTLVELARRLGLSRQAVQRLATEMVKDRLLVFETNPADKRTMHVVLTKSGTKLHAAALEREWAWTNLLAENFTVSELIGATELLQKVNESMETTPIDKAVP